MVRFPSLFVSHGSPNLPLLPCPARDFLTQLGRDLDAALGKPDQILVISPHWLTTTPIISAAPQMRAIHDFGGFPAELYQMTYPAPGSPNLADAVVAQLQEASIAVATYPSRGLDHGAWVPLKLMYPEADIPVTQLSVQPRWTIADQIQLGQALAPLRDNGTLILASGSATHNLSQFGRYALDDAPPTWVAEFDAWLHGAIALPDRNRLVNYRTLAPHAAQNHPTEEHLLPLFVALGAGGETAAGRLLHASFTYGILSMAAYAFE